MKRVIQLSSLSLNKRNNLLQHSWPRYDLSSRVLILNNSIFFRIYSKKCHHIIISNCQADLLLIKMLK